MAFSHRITRRIITTWSRAQVVTYAPNLTLWPRFFAPHEQRILLTAALQKLDHMETRLARQRMKRYTMTMPQTETSVLHEHFLPDEYYDFQEGHFDGVIHHYREMHLNSWPEHEVAGLSPILRDLYNICPTNEVQTHLLHLASYGEILPHVDNTSASGSWIMGVSLGGERILRMEGSNGNDDSFDVPLPSGSVYLQSDSMRYQYKHSILKSKLSDEQDPRIKQRLSIMIRVRVP
ncbi:putative alpha-ketoglutarate-dependent dioxygenase ABH7 [Termitomyces sp. J132]|nr:putative alpha-ketoglutarate-dependent dioxygenase ABH7 [Termitomyces sp. J132]